MHRKSGQDNKKVGPLSEMIAAHRRGENGLIRTPKMEGVRTTDAEDDGNGDGRGHPESGMLKSPPEQMTQSQPPPPAEKLSFEQRLQLQHNRLRHNEGAAAPAAPKTEPSGTPKPPPEQSISRFASGAAMNTPQSPVLVPVEAASADAKSPSSPHSYSAGESKGFANAADDAGRSGRSEHREQQGTGGDYLRKHRSPPPPPYTRTHRDLTESKEGKRSGVLTAAAASTERPATGMGHGQAHSPTTGVVGLGRSLDAMAVGDDGSDGDAVTSSPQSPKTESSASTVSRDNNRVSKPLDEEVERSHKEHKSRRRRKSDASSFRRRSSTTAAPMPSGAKRAIARCRGGEALPREGVVSDVVHRLLSRIDREMEGAVDEDGGEKSANSFCVAVLPPSATDKDTYEPLEDRGSGIGKTTIAALACAHGEVRSRYHDGITWIDMHRRPLGFDFEAYCKVLTSICRQIGINPQKLQLNPIVRSPGEDEKVANVRMRDRIKEARNRMGKLLTSLHRHSETSKKESSPSVLVVLDDVAKPSDIHWFQFHRSGKEHRVQINDLLVTSRTNFPGASVVAVPPLETKEAVRLLLTEADLPGNHPLAKSRIARGLVKKDCLLHPLITKYAGRWLGLKCATRGGQKGVDALLGEIHSAIKEGLGSGDNCNPVEVLSALLGKAMSPLVKGQATTIIRLCFAAFVAVFYPTATPADALEVPLQLASEFFLKVAEAEKGALEDDALFQSNGRQASRIVPEILAVLDVFNITQPAQLDSTIQIEHDLVRQYAKHILLEDKAFRSTRKNAEIRWNETFVLSYFEGKAITWEDVPPNLSRRYALERMPGHMLRGEMLGDLDALMCNTSFIRGRFWALGWSEGTKAHIHDAESFCNCLIAKGEGDDGSSKMVDICSQLEAVLMEEVARESGGPNGRCSTLEAGRCLHEISLSLSRFQLWDEAARFSNSCVELVESNLGASDLVASLLYNNGVIHAKANQHEAR